VPLSDPCAALEFLELIFATIGDAPCATVPFCSGENSPFAPLPTAGIIFVAVEAISNNRLAGSGEGFWSGILFRPYDAGNQRLAFAARMRAPKQVWTSPIFFIWQ